MQVDNMRGNYLQINKLPVLSICIGVIGSIVWFYFAAHIGLDLSDEGYFWYGSQRVMHGEWPIRDFLAYDLGRYFYTAGFFVAFHDTGLMTARIAAYSVIGLLIALMAFIVLDGTRRSNGDQPPAIVSGIVVALLAVLWVVPYYKVFDHAASALLVLAVYRLISTQNRAAWLMLGIFVGFVAMIGRNHGLYGVVASVLAFAILFLKPRRERPDLKDAAVWCLGIAIGYLPMILALLFVDDFAHAFVAGIQELLRNGKSNIALAVPWPWTVDIKHWGLVLSAQHAAVGLGFILLLIFPISGAVYLFRRRSIEPSDAALVAALCVAVPYAHYAFSRAELTHLAPAMLPVLIGVLTAPIFTRPRARIAVMSLLVAYSVVVLFDSTPINVWLARENHWVKTKVRNDEILVRDYQAEALLHKRRVIESRPGDVNSFLALPNMPTLHAIYETRMATYDIYVLSETLESHERDEIDRLSKALPRLILISDYPLDENEAWRFSNLRPRLYLWINSNYRRSVSTTPAGKDRLEIYVRD